MNNQSKKENVKKLLMAAIAFICMAMTSTVLTACGSDDDDNAKNYTYTIHFEMQSFSYEEISSSEEDTPGTLDAKIKAWKNSIINAY